MIKLSKDFEEARETLLTGNYHRVRDIAENDRLNFLGFVRKVLLFSRRSLDYLKK